jgi:hypothetical protein
MSEVTKGVQLSPVSSITPPKSMTSAELDELEDDFESDVDDPTVFKIRKPIQPATALLLTTKDLHGASEPSSQFSYLLDPEE